MSQCIPYYPHQHAARGAALGAEDFSAQLCREAGWRALDPLQFERARQLVAALRGDAALLELNDREMAQAPGGRSQRRTGANMAGLLLFGGRAGLERHLPTHEAAFRTDGGC